MSLERMFQNELSGFPFGFLQDVVTLLGTLEEKGISLDELKLFVREKQLAVQEELQRARLRREAFFRNSPKCPKCGGVLVLSPIRIPKGPANKNGYKSVWTCLGESCLFEEFSKLPLKEERRRKLWQ